MENKGIDQKIVQLTELMNNPGRNEGTVLRIFHDLFQLTNGSRDLSLETAEWLNKTSMAFFSPELLKVLIKLRLENYAFSFAALNFIDFEDIVDDLSNGEILRNIHSFPVGVYNKLKRELLGSVQLNSPDHSLIQAAYSSTGKTTEETNKQAISLGIQNLTLSASIYDEAILLPINNPVRRRLADELLPHCNFVEDNSRPSC